MVSADQDVVGATPDPVTCSFPGSAVEVSNNLFHDVDFQCELAYYSAIPLDPRYINALFDNILRSVGSVADVPRSSECTGMASGVSHGVGRTADVSRPFGFSSRSQSRCWIILLFSVLPTNHSYCSSCAPSQATRAIQIFPAICFISCHLRFFHVLASLDPLPQIGSPKWC